MTEKLPPALRNDGHTVSVVTPEGATRPVLGVARPDEQDKRLKLLRQWGHAPSPRAQALVTIDEPLDQRSQTILSYEVGASLRRRLNGGHGDLAQRRSAPAAATEARKPEPDSD